MPKGGRPRFEDLTETTGTPLSSEGAQMMYTRYHVATDLARGKRVLEIGCGAGQGFGLLGRGARLLVGGDVSLALLRSGQQYYRGRFPFAQLSAEALPFRDAAFDVVLFFEASYYVRNMQSAFAEIVRVLDRGGTALFVNANPERPDFIRSPHTVHYHTAEEFREVLGALGLTVTVESAFPTGPTDGDRSLVRARILTSARRLLESLRLVPRTLRGRARLKRLVYGKLQEVPGELPEGFASVAQRTRVNSGPVRTFKVIYVRARKASSAE
jgi:SAM-dependent methyltransferase